MSYRDNLPLVLKSLSFTILPEETIGIVGRTGSGIADLFVFPSRQLFQLLFLKSPFVHTVFVQAESFLLQGSPLWV